MTVEELGEEKLQKLIDVLREYPNGRLINAELMTEVHKKAEIEHAPFHNGQKMPTYFLLALEVRQRLGPNIPRT